MEGMATHLPENQINMTAQDYLDSIQASLDDLRAAAASGVERVPLSQLRELDRHVAAIRDLWVEYRVPKHKTLVEVFAEEERRRNLKP